MDNLNSIRNGQQDLIPDSCGVHYVIMHLTRDVLMALVVAALKLPELFLRFRKARSTRGLALNLHLSSRSVKILKCHK